VGRRAGVDEACASWPSSEVVRRGANSSLVGAGRRRGPRGAARRGHSVAGGVAVAGGRCAGDDGDMELAGQEGIGEGGVGRGAGVRGL